MTKFHHVQALEFEGDDLILKFDDQVPPIRIHKISYRLAQSNSEERSIYQVSPEDMEFTGAWLMRFCLSGDYKIAQKLSISKL